MFPDISTTLLAAFVFSGWDTVGTNSNIKIFEIVKFLKLLGFCCCCFVYYFPLYFMLLESWKERRMI